MQPEFHVRAGKSPPITQRVDKGRFWWELRSCSYYEEFKSPRVTWQFLSRRHKFAYIDYEAYSSQNTFSAPGVSKWMLALLNSRVLIFFHAVRNATVPGSLAAVGKEQVAEYPIVEPAIDDKKQLESLAEKLINSHDIHEIEDYEQAVNEVAYRVYELIDAERRVIQQWFERRSVIDAAVQDR